MVFVNPAVEEILKLVMVYFNSEMLNYFTKNPKKVLLLLNIILALGLVFSLQIIWKNYPQNENETENLLLSSEVSKMAGEIFSECKKSNSWHECYKVELSKTTKTYGLKTGTEILNLVQAQDPNSRNCHVISHFMSREAIKRNPNNLDQLLDELDVNACGSGFLHGVLEAYVGMHPALKIEDFANEVCNRGTEYKKRMCAHFIGHVFLLNTEGDLQLAVGLCHKLQDAWLFDCLDGAFMEDHQKLALVEHEVAKQPVLNDEYIKQMENTCAKFKQRAELMACWTEMAEMYAHTYGYDAEIIYKNCLRAKDLQDQRACYGKGVVVMAIYMGFESEQKIQSLCKHYKTSPQDEQWCVSSVLSALIYYSPKFVDRGITACGLVSPDLQAWCFEKLKNELKTVMPDAKARQDLCNGLSEADKQICLKYEI